MAKLIGTGNNQVPTNGMLGGMAFQSPEDVQVDKLQEEGYNVVTQQDIGTAPNQVPINGFLGSLAYLDSIQGIDFSPSTGTGGTATSNILDDYEEGNLNPLFTSSGVTILQGQEEGFYTKIGNLVFYSFSANFTTSSASGSNEILIRTPFVVKSATYNASYGLGSTASLNGLPVRLHGIRGTSTARLVNASTNAVITPTSAAIVSSVVKNCAGSIVFLTQ